MQHQTYALEMLLFTLYDFSEVLCCINSKILLVIP